MFYSLQILILREFHFSPPPHAVIERELGRPMSTVYASISPDPVAAASLGQVYKATLVGSNREVAVKVQRPGVVEMIAMDVFILRYMALALRKVCGCRNGEETGRQGKRGGVRRN